MKGMLIMKKFRSSIFNGYHKKDVDEYIEFLVGELDSLKEETAQALEQQKQIISELELQLNREKETKGQLESQIQEEERRAAQRNAEMDEKIRSMSEKLKKYEESCEAVPRTLAIAKADAEQMLTDARRNADQILTDAKSNVEQMKVNAQREVSKARKKAEEEIHARQEMERRNYMAAKYKLQKYLDSLNTTQERLISTYNELGQLVSQMPIRLGDVFSDEPMELLKEQTRGNREKTSVSISEVGEE